MKKYLLLAAVFAFFSATVAYAQEPQPYGFKEEIKLSATSVKNQEKTGTCWAFSGLSFIESEAKRLGKGEVDLSEMFTVRHIYRQKCENFVRRQGTAQFSEGGLAHDAIHVLREYGVVPEDVYPGRKDPLKPFNHSTLEKTLRTKCDALVELGKKGELPTDWLKEIDALLDAEFGPLPTKFKVGNNIYMAHQYRDFLGLNADNYITLTSFTHHPLYKPFVLEVPDNFSNGLMYNVPLDEFMRAINYSLQKGFTVQWDADVSNDGFSAKNGLAIVPMKEWKEKNDAQRNGTFKYLEPQKQVTAAYRQELFDKQVTTDDHLMHITGIEAETNSADIYYTVKNSWGEISDLKGYLRVSEAYVRLNTISVLVNKSGVPLDLLQRVGLAEGDVRIPAAQPKVLTPDQSDTKINKVTPKASQTPNRGVVPSKSRPAQKN